MKNKHLQYITDTLNKAFPERLELKFGCEFTDGQDRYKIVNSSKGTNNVEGLAILENQKNPIRIGGLEHFKILGTPPTILEVLRWLENRKIQLQSNGVLQEVSGDNYYSEQRKIIANIGLSSPLIKDQSEKTIKQLAELMGFKDEDKKRHNKKYRN